NPGDDTTVCTIRIRRREPMNMLFGPPHRMEDGNKMMSLFFSKEGKHIVCGGTTSGIVSRYLGKPLVPTLDFFDPQIPPIAKIEGVDLVTEGVITVNKVLEYARDYLADNEAYSLWGSKKDGASQIARLLFEEATDINFYVGRAINPAHQNPNLPINFNIKMQLVEELAAALKSMGKRIKVSYF
ncbi:MAG: serine/threonine-protein phosphatase, partial [Angelakisella sp.]